MNLESMYRLSQVRTRDTNTVERRARLYSLGPIKEMIKRHWLEPSENITILETAIYGVCSWRDFGYCPEILCSRG